MGFLLPESLAFSLDFGDLEDEPFSTSYRRFDFLCGISTDGANDVDNGFRLVDHPQRLTLGTKAVNGGGGDPYCCRVSL